MDFSKPYNRREFVNYLRRDFLPDDFEQEERPVTFGSQMNYASSALKLGTCRSLDLVVYEIKHTSHNDARVGLSKDAFRMLAGERQNRALVIFVPEDTNANYRFSLIEIQLSIGENESNVRHTYSNPRRYSYYLGERIACYTPNKYLNQAGKVKDAKDLTERFSVEVLTKAFYQELSDWYAWAVKIVRFPNKLDDPDDDDKYNAESTIRLVTRLIFVWFLKQKHLIPDEFFDEKYIADNLLEGFTPHSVVNLFGKSTESRYYKAILQNLFFAMLNSPITKDGKSELSERHFRSGRGDYDNNKLMRYESMFKNPDLFVDLANKTVPFLNGGLFDCLDDKDNENYIDGFSDRKEVQASLIVPDFLFFGEEVGKNIDLSEWYGDKKKKKVSARGIIDILKRYNFTVEENTPFDQDVSLDPELLGKVFENLLASYNPETQTTARKQTGSFYTPREIVQYMVDESLVAHLKRTVGEELETEYRKLLQYTDDEISLSDEQKDRIIQSLYDCKILDPACGSGAFPVGILQQMVHILSRIDPNNERWKEMILDDAVNETRSAFKSESNEEREERIKDIERSFDDRVNNPDYARKLYLIENCIYGVDIQPIAIQISKLRFFISLVVDQHTNNNPIDNFGIRPLPNLEAKFVAANTLIPLSKSTNNLGRTPDIIAIEDKLKEANHKIFNAKTVKTKRKWKERLSELRAELIDELSENGFLKGDAINQLASWNMFDQNASASFFDPEWMFGIEEGFHIVIANPPYGAKLNEQDKVYFNKEYHHQDYQLDSYMLFIERGLQLIKNIEGTLSYIIPNTWLSNITSVSIRKLLFNSTDIINIVHLDGSIFKAVVDTEIIIATKKSKILDEIKVSLKQNNRERSWIINQYEFQNGDPVSLFIDNTLKELVEKIKCHQILGDICRITQGAKPFQKGKGIPKQTKEIVDNKPFVSSTYQDGMRPLLRGSLMDKYKINWNNNYWIAYGKWLAEPRPSANYNAPLKIVIRQTGDSLVAALDDKQFIVRDNLYTIVPNVDSVNLRTILGLLNSKLINWFYQNVINHEQGEALAQVKKAHLIKLPIASHYDPNINNLVDDIMLSSDVVYRKKLMNKLDNIIYHLYGITYEEIIIIDPTTSITREEYENFRF